MGHRYHMVSANQASSVTLCYDPTMKAWVNNPKYWHTQAFANSVDPDETLQNAVSHQDLHCLSYILCACIKGSQRLPKIALGLPKINARKSGTPNF